MYLPVGDPGWCPGLHLLSAGKPYLSNRMNRKSATCILKIGVQKALDIQMNISIQYNFESNLNKSTLQLLVDVTVLNKK